MDTDVLIPATLAALVMRNIIINTCVLSEAGS